MFPQRDPSPSAADGGRGRALQAHRAGRRSGEGAHDQLQPRARRLIAKKYPQNELPLLVLIQEGSFGLIRATEKLDWRRGFRFSTHATYWIRQATQRAIENTARTIRVPTNIAQRERKIQRTRRALSTKLGREPTDEEIAEEAELELGQVEAMADVTRTVTSLDRPIGDKDGRRSATSSTTSAPARPRRSSPPGRRRAAPRPAGPHRGRAQARRGAGADCTNGDCEDIGPVGIREASRRLGITQPETRRLEERALERLAN